MPLIIFTGLDRVLLPRQDGHYDQVKQTLRKLQAKEIPIIGLRP